MLIIKGLIALCAVLCLINVADGYTTTGNKLYDGNGKLVRARGFNKCSFEWSAVGEHASLADYTLMASWGANIVRLPMNQDFWLSGSSSYVSGYAATIQQQVTWITSLGMGVILDLHWSDQGNLAGTPGQQCMADTNSLTFWQQVATAYKNNPWVMFEAYNEPHDVSWSVWLNGGNGGGSCNYQVVGMQQIYNTIRATGANNVIVFGGLNYAYDLSGVAQYPVVGSNIAYATHPYDYAGKQSSNWQSGFGYLAATNVVIATEYGQYCNSDTYVNDLVNYLESNGIHWTVWAWYVSGCNFPSVISDWSGTPLAPAGTVVSNLFTTLGLKQGSPTTKAPTTTPTTTTTTKAPATTTTAPGQTTTTTKAPVTTTAPTTTKSGGTSLGVYVDSLLNNFQSYGWASDLTYTATAYTYGASQYSISFTIASNAAMYLHTTTSFAVTTYSTLTLYANGGSASGQQLKVILYDTEATPAVVGSAVNLPVLSANTWTAVSIATSAFGYTGQISGFAVQGVSGTTKVYLDSISWNH